MTQPLPASLEPLNRQTRQIELALPGYRKWVYLGSGLGMSYTATNDENPPFTNVFADPAAYDKIHEDGHMAG